MNTTTEAFNSFNQEKETAQLPTFDSIATDLLSDEKIKRLPEIEQGRVIADRFIGALIRHGDVVGSQKTYAPEEVIEGMDNLSKAGRVGLQEITGTDGLRKAVLALATDERVGREFGALSARLASDERGQPVLTSTAQMEGYLLSGGKSNYVKDPVGGVHMNGDSWIPVMMEHAEHMLKTPHSDWMSYGKARELMTSSAPLIQNTGRDWEKAMHSAERVGVDLDLLKRSAEKIQQRVKARHDMGGTALFAATEGKINSYRDDLNRRSQTY